MTRVDAVPCGARLYSPLDPDRRDTMLIRARMNVGREPKSRHERRYESSKSTDARVFPPSNL